jgi:hypothetical protein
MENLGIDKLCLLAAKFLPLFTKTVYEPVTIA